MIRNFFLAILLFVLCWLLGFSYFMHHLPNKPATNIPKQDAIVMLTGGSGRLDQAIMLLSQGYGGKLLITGIDANTTKEELLAPYQIPMHLWDDIIPGYLAKNTYENAIETALWMDLEAFDTMLLVTANYHMPRSLFLFKKQMPDIEIVAYPVFPRHVKTERWWNHFGTSQLLIGEFHKWLGTLIKRNLDGTW